MAYKRNMRCKKNVLIRIFKSPSQRTEKISGRIPLIDSFCSCDIALHACTNIEKKYYWTASTVSLYNEIHLNSRIFIAWIKINLCVICVCFVCMVFCVRWIFCAESTYESLMGFETSYADFRQVLIFSRESK